jgi:hypothetical protein
VPLGRSECAARLDERTETLAGGPRPATSSRPGIAGGKIRAWLAELTGSRLRPDTAEVCEQQRDGRPGLSLISAAGQSRWLSVGVLSGRRCGSPDGIA